MGWQVRGRVSWKKIMEKRNIYAFIVYLILISLNEKIINIFVCVFSRGASWRRTTSNPEIASRETESTNVPSKTLPLLFSLWRLDSERDAGCRMIEWRSTTVFKSGRVPNSAFSSMIFKRSVSFQVNQSKRSKFLKRVMPFLALRD